MARTDSRFPSFPKFCSDLTISRAQELLRCVEEPLNSVLLSLTLYPLAGEFDNAGAMMSVDETLLCSFQVSTTVRRFYLGATDRAPV